MRKCENKGTVITFAFLMMCLCIWNSILLHAEPKAFDYILPYADSQYYTVEELEDMSLQVLCYARNEIYARHNRIFKSGELTEYFELQPWYTGTISASDFDNSILNEFEQENIRLLKAMETTIKKEGYSLDKPGYSFDEIDRYISSHAQNKVVPEYIGIAENLEYDEITRVLSTVNFTMEIPYEWQDHYGIANETEDAISFYCNLVREKDRYAGNLMLICRYNDYTPEEDFPNARYIGEREGYHYYAMFPTDVQFNPDDVEGMTLYREMYAVAEEITETIRLR